ncbi:MAG: ABC transporter permease [Aristaeellaceae bacterium]
MKKRFNWKHIYKQYGTQITMAAVLIVLCIALTIASPFFLKKSNILNIFVSFSVSGTMAAGLTVVMLMGCMDLSQYAVMALVGMVVALSLQAGLNAWLAILLGVVLGTGIGAINAFIVTKMHIVPMIATISTQLMCRAGAYLVNNGQYVRVTDKLFDTIGFGRLFGVNYLVYIVLIVFLIIGYVLKNTTFGRKVYAVGGNPVASELSGINVNRLKFMGFMISGATAGLAATLITAQVAAAMPTAGTGSEMDGIAAVFLGGVAFDGGKGRVGGTLIGVLLLTVLANGMTLLNIPPYYQQFTKGAVLLLSVYMDAVRTNRNKFARAHKS